MERNFRNGFLSSLSEIKFGKSVFFVRFLVIFLFHFSFDKNVSLGFLDSSAERKTENSKGKKSVDRPDIMDR